MALVLLAGLLLAAVGVRVGRRCCRKKAEKFEEVEYAGEHQYT